MGYTNCAKCLRFHFLAQSLRELLYLLEFSGQVFGQQPLLQLGEVGLQACAQGVKIGGVAMSGLEPRGAGIEFGRGIRPHHLAAGPDPLLGLLHAGLLAEDGDGEENQKYGHEADGHTHLPAGRR